MLKGKGKDINVGIQFGNKIIGWNMWYSGL